MPKRTKKPKTVPTPDHTPWDSSGVAHNTAAMVQADREELADDMDLQAGSWGITMDEMRKLYPEAVSQAERLTEQEWQQLPASVIEPITPAQEVAVAIGYVERLTKEAKPYYLGALLGWLKEQPEPLQESFILALAARLRMR